MKQQQAMAASGDLYDVNRMGLQYITPLIQAGAVQSLDDYLLVCSQHGRRLFLKW